MVLLNRVEQDYIDGNSEQFIDYFTEILKTFSEDDYHANEECINVKIIENMEIIRIEKLPYYKPDGSERKLEHKYNP